MCVFDTSFRVSSIVSRKQLAYMGNTFLIVFLSLFQLLAKLLSVPFALFFFI